MKTVILATMFAAGCYAQPLETPPALGAAKPFNLPAGDSFTLGNGMRVTLVPYGSVPLVSVRAVIDGGHSIEGAGEVWLLSLAIHLMKEGTRTLTPEQIANEAARMGGQVDVTIGSDQSFASLNVLGEFAGDAVKLIADILQHPSLPESELDRVRNDALRQRSVDLATPQSQANQAFAAHLFPDHPYGRMYPSEAELKGYTIDQVRKFYAANVGARRTHLYVVGRFDPAVKKTVQSAFEGWAAGPAVKHTPPTPAAKGEMVLVDRPGAVQSTLRVGLPLNIKPGDPDYFAMQVTNSLLGGAFTSRITNNIREQKGYTYSPGSQVNTRYRSALWQETADVTTKFTAPSIHEILFEIDRLRKDPPDARELKGIQNYMGGIFVFQNTSNSGIIGQLAFVDLHGLGSDFLQQYIQKVNAVTRQDVQRITETYLNPAKMTYVVVGDKSQVEESLKAYPPK